MMAEPLLTEEHHMAKKKVQLKKAKKVAARKVEPKKKVKAVPASKATATPNKKAKAVPASRAKVTSKKAPPKKGATERPVARKSAKKKAMPANVAAADRLRKELRALPHPQLYTYWQQCYGVQLGVMGEEAIHLAIDGHIQHLQEAGRDEDIVEEVNRVESIKREASKVATQAAAEKPLSHPDLRQSVAELLNKLNDDTLQWLHFEITDPDAEGEIETDEEAEEAMATFPPLNRPALVQELTTIAVDDLQLADQSDLGKWLKDEQSIRMFLISFKP
jgi:hypothetical protein